MFELFKIMGTIGVDNSDANSSLEETEGKAENTSKSIGQKMMDGLGRAEQAIGTAGTALTKWVSGPIIAAGAGIFGLMTSTGNYADRVLDLRDITGLSTDAIQEWSYVADIAGVSGEAVTNAVTGLVRRLPQLQAEGGKATDALGKMGLSYEDLNKLSPDEQVDTLMNSLAAMEDPLERNAAGSALFGGAWQDLAPILGMGAEEMANTRDEAHLLGAVMSEDALSDANAFRQEMERLKNEFMGIVREISGKFVPIFQDTIAPLLREVVIPAIMDLGDNIVGLIEWFSGLDPVLQNNIVKWIAIAVALGPFLVLISKIIGVVTPIIGIFTTLAGAVSTAWGVFAAGGGVIAALKAGMLVIMGPIGWITAGIVALIAIGVLLWKNWDTIKQKSSQIWGAIKAFFSKTLSDLSNNVSKKSKEISDKFVANVTALKDKGIARFNELKDKAISKVQELISGAINKATELKNKFTQKVIETKNKAVQGFQQLKDGAVSKISETVSSIQSKFSNVYQKITDPINRARDAVKRAIDKMKSFFNFQWKLPKIKMPKFSVSGSKNPIDWITQGVPKLKVDWFAKGGIMQKATAFGMNGDSLQVGGEAGREAVLPLNKSNLAGIGAGIAQASGFDINGIKEMLWDILDELRSLGDRPVIVNVELDGKVIARVTRDPLDREFGKKKRDKSQAKGRK